MAARGRARLAPLKLGLAVPRSGYLAALGEGCTRGARLGLKLTAELGLPRIELLEGDTGESADSAVAAARALALQGAQLLVGCYDSAQTVAVAEVAEQLRVPFLINVGAAPTITQQGYRFVFRNFPDALRIVRDSYALQKQLFALTGYTPRSVALLYINNGRGIELIDSEWMRAHMPYERAASISYDPRSPDLSAEVAAARASGADAIWTVSRMDDAIRITRELVRMDWTPGILMSSNASLHESAYRSALGVYAEYAITFAPFYAPQTPLSRKVHALLDHEEPGAVLGTAEVYTCEALLIAADAYRRASSPAGEPLAQALRETHLTQSLTGPPIRFDGHGQNTRLGLTAIQNLNGQGRVVLPRSAAQARPVLPMPAWSERPHRPGGG
ncbi:MAG TPA: ABC transporter substrate-binding protein [Steroidobacteraceae bacterium]|nr:ABC transporter substrate-binding protein [Steroidobacteraceae bacterium]